MFERMSGLSRGFGGKGADREDEDEAGGTVAPFPQFLNRQGNQ